MGKKDFTKATGAAATKFFTTPAEEPVPQQEAENTNNIDGEYVNVNDIANNNKDSKYTHITNKSKHYDKRGKREVRQALMLDRQLKDDLTLLCHATGSRSINDYIVSLLIEHTERSENQKLLEDYSKLKRG